MRLDIARKHGLIDPGKFNFLWVVDFPLFEYSEQEGRWMAMHHPFTLPKAEDLDKIESDPGACHAVAYDIVLNGVELGGGSMRINDPELQDRMFRALGFTEEKARASFGFLMDAYKYGAPPHGGMAYGLDRLVMLMLGRDSIRDVIAFPKVQNAGEPMSGAPDVVDEKQLADLSIALTLPEKNDTEGRPRQQACCRGRPFCAGTIICRFFVPFCAPPVGEQFFQGNGLPRPGSRS